MKPIAQLLRDLGAEHSASEEAILREAADVIEKQERTILDLQAILLQHAHPPHE